MTSHVFRSQCSFQQGPQRDQKKDENAEDWKAARFCHVDFVPTCISPVPWPGGPVCASQSGAIAHARTRAFAKVSWRQQKLLSSVSCKRLLKDILLLEAMHPCRTSWFLCTLRVTPYLRAANVFRIVPCVRNMISYDITCDFICTAGMGGLHVPQNPLKARNTHRFFLLLLLLLLLYLHTS